MAINGNFVTFSGNSAKNVSEVQQLISKFGAPQGKQIKIQGDNQQYKFDNNNLVPDTSSKPPSNPPNNTPLPAPQVSKKISVARTKAGKKQEDVQAITGLEQFQQKLLKDKIKIDQKEYEKLLVKEVISQDKDVQDIYTKIDQKVPKRGLSKLIQDGEIEYDKKFFVNDNIIVTGKNKLITKDNQGNYEKIKYEKQGNKLVLEDYNNELSNDDSDTTVKKFSLKNPSEELDIEFNRDDE